MSIRYVTIDFEGHIYEVTHFFTDRSVRTFDPKQASTCVIKLSPTQSSEADIEDVPIYTVH